MTTPLDYANDILDRSQRLVRVVSAAAPDEDSLDADLLRSAWVFIGAAVDTYFHERVRRDMLKGGLSKKGAKFEIPLADVDSILKEVIENRDANTRPRVPLKKAIQEQLGFQTFQGHRNIETAFALIGVTDYWSTISAALGPATSVQQVKNHLNRQYSQRNRISHEGDLLRQERPQKLKYNNIARIDVQREINWTRKFVAAADAVA